MIQLESIGHDYGSGVVLEGIDTCIAAGQVTVVCGPNAVGKTTLLRIAAGLLEPTQGRVSLGAQPIAALSPLEQARRRGYMSQRFECSTGFTVRQVLRLAGLAGSTRAGDVEPLLDSLELSSLMKRSVATLSTGQAQRVAFARLLLQCPDDGALILDEPFAALDPRWSSVLGDQLRQRAAAGGTVLLSIHDLGLVGQLADRVLLLAETRVAAHGPVESVLVDEVLAPAYGIGFEVLRSGNGGPIPISVRR